MSTSSKEKEKVAGAVGGKTARACDGCLRRRARWYCAADDAFLCQSCDMSVHSANPLARRHERLRLRVSSTALPSSTVTKAEEMVVPAWFTRKARTPRGKHGALTRRVVPDSVESSDENRVEEQLLYHVPIFDPALAEFCSPPPLEDSNNSSKGEIDGDSIKSVLVPSQFNVSPSINDSIVVNFTPTDADLNEFAADMEALLGKNNEDSFDMESLGLMESPEELDGANVKLETVDGGANEELYGVDLLETEVSGEMLDIDFDCGSPMTLGEEEEKIAIDNMMCHEVKPCLQHKFVLRLDYEAIIASWGSSPWTDGERPQGRLDECWPDYSEMWIGSGRGGVGAHGSGEPGVVRSGMDGGREARVSRYREKRRTRLFSKKIRYEVRKLNAEKRPRMKGRFVKRSSPLV
ncbi:zinc finger CONSTANS-like protein [Rhynchospora pubera]|uniref:Zinc finger CONSTANS-like protein n=1 Tax=Rhynchospora pubera TaxID=906938 RepID=A0AAV8D6A8_9POAL|nr:zinc finger CONSTANS-like protein [Rhynchospora pubera]